MSIWSSHNAISLCYRLAIEAEKVKESPIHRKVRKQEENNSRVRYLSPDEETKLRTTPHEPEFDFTIATGLRRCNMYAATWQDVDLAARTLTIPCMKNGDAIKLPLNQDAMRALSIFLSRGDGTGRIVRNVAGFPLSFNAHWFVPAVRASGIKPFRSHECRHTFASRPSASGGSVTRKHRGVGRTQRARHDETLRASFNFELARGRVSNFQ
jgi:integrase